MFMPEVKSKKLKKNLDKCVKVRLLKRASERPISLVRPSNFQSFIAITFKRCVSQRCDECVSARTDSNKRSHRVMCKERYDHETQDAFLTHYEVQ